MEPKQATPGRARHGPTARRVAMEAATRVAVPAGAAIAASMATAATPLLAENLFLLFLVVILGSGLVGGLLPGVVAAVSSTLGAAFFLFDPTPALAVAGTDDRVRAGLLLATGLLISLLSRALRSARQRVAERERALAQSEESYRAIFDQSADALYILDRQGRILEANAAAARLYGRPAASMVGLTPDDLSDPDRTEYDRDRSRIERVFAGEAQRFTWWGRRSDGTSFAMEIVLSQARYFGRSVALAVARDLTAQRELEEQLRQSQKMEAVGRLAGGVSHDFNNLLTTIRGHAALMKDALPEDDPLRDDVQEIDRAADLATHVTRQLLTFSRSADTGEPRRIALNPVLEGLEKMLRRVIGTDIGIVLDLDPAAGAVRMDPGQLEQVVLNLVVNARDAMPDGGTITLRTTAIPGPSTGDGEAGPGRVQLSVRDTGIGMDAATVERVFEPFFTTKPKDEGTGLGLSTVYGIVQQAGGRIRVDSAPGRGSTFRVELPAVPTETEEPVRAAAPDAAPAAGRILLVEDEAPVRTVMARILGRAGFEVTVAACADEAWEAFEAHPPTLMITDVSMPGESGPELARRVRDRDPELPVLFASGSDGLRPDAPQVAPPVLFLQKPFTPAELTRAVSQLLEETVAPVG